MFHSLKRKRFFVVTLALLLIALSGTFFLFKGSPTPASAHNAPAPTTLGAAAALKGRTFGAAMTSNVLSDTQYSNVLSTEFTGTTPGNEMKWETTEPTRNSFNFAPADAIISFAQSHHMKVRGHTLVWHSQLASWVSDITTGSDLLQAMKNHIAGEASHFKGKVVSWDVVNEAFNEDGTRRASPFEQLIGDNYIAEAFKATHAADPHALLCYNDYNIEGINAKSDAVYAMVKDFKAHGVPIDCVGFQSHFIVGQLPADIQANLQRFAKLGVTVQITELDIRMPVPASSTDLQQQATDYKNVVAACLAVARCNNITTWGVYDGDSWIPQFFSGYGAALLFDENFQKKPAYNAVFQTLLGYK
ncbi:MAG TPA: endo-1,4-beta-xylanase [Ktedonobacteraceae bacterium]